MDRALLFVATACITMLGILALLIAALILFPA
jgi:hypothetical protein